MNKLNKSNIFFAVCAIVIICAFGFNSCDNQFAKHYGGTITINVEKGYKVTEATWKDDQFWYMTEPMDENYQPKTKKFIEHSEYGILEGCVKFVESK